MHIHIVNLRMAAAAAIAALSLVGCVDTQAGRQNTEDQRLKTEALTELKIRAGGIEATRWADSVYNALTPRERVAQLFVAHLDGSGNEAAKAAVTRAAKAGCGGILLSKGTAASHSALINLGQSSARLPLMVTLDGEWGPAMRMTDAPRFPYNVGLAGISDPALMYDYGREVARECRELGIQVDFAPVVDVNTNPANPVIGYRALGDDPDRIAALAAAWARGLEDGGVLSVAKHFPGHGDTSQDSHKTLPTVGHARARLDSVELRPFCTYISHGLGGIMVGHLRVPALDATGTPASLSHPVVTGLLRDSLSFDGLVFTDALEMKGASVPGVSNSVAALRVGADVLLCPANLKADIDAVMAAIDADPAFAARAREACIKLLRWKYALGLSERPAPSDPKTAARRIGGDEAADMLRRLAEGSVTVVRDRLRVLPLDSLGTRTFNVVCLGAQDSVFVPMLRNYAEVTRRTTAPADIEAMAASEVNIVAVFGNSATVKTQWERLRDLPGLVPVFFINPYKMAAFGNLEGLPVLVAAYDDTPELRRAAAQALFGGIGVDGRWPVDLPGTARRGSGVSYPKSRLGYASPYSQGFNPTSMERLDSIARAAVAAGAMPGCRVLVARKGRVVYDKSFGRVTPGGEPVNGETIYDIASMSKAIGTLPGIMKAYDEGLLGIDDRLGTHIPELEGTDKGELTLRQLLYHESGMPPTLNVLQVFFDSSSYTGTLTKARKSTLYPHRITSKLWGNARAKLRRDITSPSRSVATPWEAASGLFVGPAAYDTIMQRIYDMPLRDKRYRYSCLNFALLMEVEQRLTGVDHDQWIETEILGPLGAWSTLYRPLERFDAARIAPTEKDAFLRRQHLRGYVHDELAAMSGGVQGNAGLFATARDVAKVAQMWLNGGVYGRTRILSEETVRLFTTVKSPTCERGLGFDRVTNLRSLAECGAPAETYGHTGFTGTCFWVDPVNEIIFVFLSNRVNPVRDNAAWTRTQPRASLMTALYRSIRY